MYLKFFSNKPLFLMGLIIALSLGVLIIKNKQIPYSEQILTAKTTKKNFSIDVKTIGELEAAYSTNISSTARGDQCKIIYLVPDGINVEKGEVLVKLDPTPFEEKVEQLKTKIREQEAHVASLKKMLDWEVSQAEKDDKTAAFEVEAAELELNKIIHGDGPQEIARLKSVMQKAWSKYEEFHSYSNDLVQLNEEGFLNPTELKNAQKKLEEEREAYEMAKSQYDGYVHHVYPMQVKKAEAALKQAKMKQEETNKIRGHAIGKAIVDLEQTRQALEEIKLQHRAAERELALTEIQAPAPGMVVHREDFRSGQRRKPRLGDPIVRNQVILDLPDLNRMNVKSKVREVDLCKIEIGKQATVEIDAYPQLYFTGSITSIGVLALPDPGRPSDEKYFEIRIALDKSDPRVRPGMTTRVLIHADQVNNALTIPVHALFYDQKKAYCYVPSHSRYEKKEVIVGATNEEWAEIKSGLNEGDIVCLSLPDTL